MTIKKSELLALLEDLPEEFERETYIELADQLEGEGVPAWQLDAAFEASEDVRKNGGRTIKEFEANAKAWIEKHT